MSELNEYLTMRGITEEQMNRARAATHAYVDAYALREARSEGGLTQVQLAQAMGVSQSRVSRIGRGDIGGADVGGRWAAVSVVIGRLRDLVLGAICHLFK